MEEPPEDPAVQHAGAAAALLGCLIGVLREKGVLTPDDEEAVFAMAEEAMRQAGTPVGTTFLNIARNLSSNLSGTSR